jgi:phage terminase Nu1 subunit (DNA packaging protein)
MIISKSELAEELDVSPGRVTQYIQRGMPTLPNGKVDLLKACRWLCDNLDSSNAGPALGHAKEWRHLLSR